MSYFVRANNCALKTSGGSAVFISTSVNFSFPHFTVTVKLILNNFIGCNIIHEQCFYGSRCQSLLRIDIIIMALGSIFAGEVQVYDCIFCENESGYASIIQKLMFLCFKTSVFIQI